MPFSASFRPRGLGALAIIMGALLIGAPGARAETAVAHPLGNFSSNYYTRLEASPSQVRAFYVMDLAEVPTFQLKAKIDTNGDGKLDAGEQNVYLTSKVEELRKGMRLTANGAPLALQTRSPSLQILPGQGGLETLRLTFWADAALPALGAEPMKIEYVDGNENERLGWREIVLRTRDGASVSEANVSDKDISDELRNYPEDLLSQPLKQLGAAFLLSASGAPSQAAAVNAQTTKAFGASSTDAQFAALINAGNLTPSVLLASLLTALVLGAVHALEPGHGKSVAAAYLVGTRATPYHAVLLGGTVTVTHTASVFVMGLVTLFLQNFILPEKLFPYLGILSAAIVIVMGANMIWQALRKNSRPRDLAHDHTHDHAHDHTHDHTHDHNHDHDGEHGGSGVHTHGGKAHSHAPPEKLSVRSVLAVGVSGGLVPCPAALIVLLSAIALGRVGFGMLLIVVFGLGLAGVLTAISLLVVFSKRMLGKSAWAARFTSRLNQTGRFVQLLPIFSGTLVIAAGLLLLFYALPFLRILN